jgi:hypothetical protein
MHPYPIIEALKPYKEHFNVAHFLNLPTDSDFGNLTVSWMDIVTRFECINDSIVQIYQDFDNLYTNKKSSMIFLDQAYKQKLLIEQIFYWLRKSADEIISILYLLDYFKTHKKYPKKINTSSIGDVLKSEGPIKKALSKHVDHLQILNEISNAYKHSFLNSQINDRRGSEYPVVFSCNLHHNDLKNKPEFHIHDLRKILNAYNMFLIETKNLFIKKYKITQQK